MLVLYDYGGCIDHSVILKLTNRLAISLDKEVAVVLIIWADDLTSYVKVEYIWVFSFPSFDYSTWCTDLLENAHDNNHTNVSCGTSIHHHLPFWN